MAARLGVLEMGQLTDTGQSSAELLGIEVAPVTERLTSHLVREILLKGQAAGR